MKKKVLKKLNFKKQTISTLDDAKMAAAKGGWDPSVQFSCDPCETIEWTCPSKSCWTDGC